MRRGAFQFVGPDGGSAMSAALLGERTSMSPHSSTSNAAWVAVRSDCAAACSDALPLACGTPLGPLGGVRERRAARRRREDRGDSELSEWAIRDDAHGAQFGGTMGAQVETPAPMIWKPTSAT